MTTPDEDETEPVDGVTVGKTRRVVFTALAIVAFVFVMVCTYEYTFGYEEACFEESIANFSIGDVLVGMGVFEFDVWEEVWWAIPAFASLPILLLSAARHNSPEHLFHDKYFYVASPLIALSISCAFYVGDDNYQTGSENGTLAVDYLTGLVDETMQLSIPQAHPISPLWLLIPTTLTIAFIVVGARRRGIRDAAQLAAGDEE